MKLQKIPRFHNVLGNFLHFSNYPIVDREPLWKRWGTMILVLKIEQSREEKFCGYGKRSSGVNKWSSLSTVYKDLERHQSYYEKIRTGHYSCVKTRWHRQHRHNRQTPRSMNDSETLSGGKVSTVVFFFLTQVVLFGEKKVFKLFPWTIRRSFVNKNWMSFLFFIFIFSSRCWSLIICLPDIKSHSFPSESPAKLRQIFFQITKAKR